MDHVNAGMEHYSNYFTEIESFYQTKRKSWTLITCLDWILIENWQERGVPLELVLKGIDRAFSRAKRDITHLAYCVKAVEEVCEEQKEPAGQAPMPDFQQDEVAAYVQKLAAHVEKLDAGIAASIRAADLTELRSAEQTLGALEEKLIAKLKFTADDKTMIEVKKEVDGELNPFRSTMTAAQLSMFEQQMWRRKLLERFGIPRLSFFYLI